jgi:hypothetical protein
MPTPNTDNAPYFRGSRVDDFLDALETHADNAKIPHSSLPAYVPRYCSDSIRQMIRRHSVWSGGDWAAARAFLLKLYASADKDPLITSDRLRAWVKKHAAEGIFSRSQDVDKYYRKFITQSDYLIDQQEILSRDVKLLFFQGIPDSIRKKIRKGLPSVNQKISNPPDIDVTLGLLQREFDDTDIDAVVGDVDLNILTDSEEDSDSDVESTVKRKDKKKKKKTVRFETRTVPAAPAVEPVPMTDIDALNRRVEELALEKQRLLQELATQRLPASTLSERKCFICDGTFIHRLGIMDCPEMKNLINEGLAMYSPQGRLIRSDGKDLPRGSGPGGVAKVLREERALASDPTTSRKGKEREQPPHFAQPAGILYNGQDLLSRDVHAISSLPSYGYPATRSQKEPLYEPYPSKKPERKQKPAPILPPAPKRTTGPEVLPAPSTQVPPQPSKVTTTPSKPKPTPAPVAPPPQPPYQNTADAWQEKKKVQASKKPEQDTELQDATKSKSGYHFTSTIQDMADGDAIQNQILNTIITLPLRDVIGISADLQKRFANLTKTRREYTQKAAVTAHGYGDAGEDCHSEGESDSSSHTDEEYAPENAAVTSRLQFSYGMHENIEEVLERYSSAVSLQAAPLFAMSTGRFEGSMAGQSVTFMVDTGSELNLISAEFYR